MVEFSWLPSAYYSYSQKTEKCAKTELYSKKQLLQTTSNNIHHQTLSQKVYISNKKFKSVQYVYTAQLQVLWQFGVDYRSRGIPNCITIIGWGSDAYPICVETG